MSGTRVEGYIKSDGTRVAGYYRGGSASVESRGGKTKYDIAYKGAKGEGRLQKNFDGTVNANLSNIPLGGMMGLPTPFDDVVGGAHLDTRGGGVAAGASLSSALGFAGINRDAAGNITGEVKLNPKAVAGAIANHLNNIKETAVEAVQNSPQTVVKAANVLNAQTAIENMTPGERSQAIAATILQAAGFAAAGTLIPGALPARGAYYGANAARQVYQTYPAIAAAPRMLPAALI